MNMQVVGAKALSWFDRSFPSQTNGRLALTKQREGADQQDLGNSGVLWGLTSSYQRENAFFHRT